MRKHIKKLPEARRLAASDNLRVPTRLNTAKYRDVSNIGIDLSMGI